MQRHRRFHKPGGFVVALACLSASLASAAAADAETAIKAQMDKQVQDWNRGNIPAFVESYAQDCIFVGKQVLQGKDALLARYQHAYPTPQAMGKLHFDNLRVRQLDPNVAVVTGEWRLEKPASTENLGGLFSLVWRLDHGVWRIALDHTS